MCLLDIYVASLEKQNRTKLWPFLVGSCSCQQVEVLNIHLIQCPQETCGLHILTPILCVVFLLMTISFCTSVVNFDEIQFAHYSSFLLFIVVVFKKPLTNLKTPEFMLSSKFYSSALWPMELLLLLLYNV